MYKLYERMLLSCLTPIIEPQLIQEQARFRAGESTTSLEVHEIDSVSSNTRWKKLGVVIVGLFNNKITRNFCQ